jgi:hypothetical protein
VIREAHRTVGSTLATASAATSRQGATFPAPSLVRFRLDAHPVVDSVAELLLASEVTLGGLSGDMPKQELDLIQFAASEATQPRAGAPKVMRSELLYTRPRRRLADNLHSTLGVIPLPQSRPALLIDRKSAPSVMPWPASMCRLLPSPTLEWERYECAQLCPRDRR